MRNGFRRALCLAALTVAMLIAGAAHADGLLGYGVTYRSDKVNLRRQPTQYSDLLGSYARGSWMTINGENGNWYYVTAPDGKTGYMSKNYVEITTDDYATVGLVTNSKPTAFLNLRERPSYSAKVLGIYYNGVPFMPLSYSNGWYKVRVNDREGYFREEFVTQRYMAFSEEVATVVTPNKSGVNLRTGPGMGYPSIKRYPGGTYVMVLQKGLDWWRISVDGCVGYMSTSFLQEGVLDPASSVGDGGQDAVANGYAVVTNLRQSQLLNLRESPTTTSRVLGQYANGTRVTVLFQGLQWCKVMSASNVVGYMMTDYLTLYKLPDVPRMKVNHPQKTFVNLRAAPSMTASRVLARVPHGASVIVLSPEDGWIKVRYNGQTGYMVSYFLQDEE